MGFGNGRRPATISERATGIICGQGPGLWLKNRFTQLNRYAFGRIALHVRENHKQLASIRDIRGHL